ncbi:hypothetical protein [Streptomyces sp. NPDC002587]
MTRTAAGGVYEGAGVVLPGRWNAAPWAGAEAAASSGSVMAVGGRLPQRVAHERNGRAHP